MHIHTIQLNIETLEGGCQYMDATEFGAYMSLLICCYKSDNKLKDDDSRLARMARVSPRIWKKIKPILSEKFTISNGVWSHERVRKELLKYHKLSQKNKANALKNNKTGEPVASQSHSQTQANTSNNKQITNNNSKPPTPLKGVEVPNFIDGDLWIDWIKHRQEIKKKLTPTQSAKQIEQLTKWHSEGIDVNQVITESIQNGWQGLFKPKGKKNGKQSTDNELQAFLDRPRD